MEKMYIFNQIKIFMSVSAGYHDIFISLFISQYFYYRELIYIVVNVASTNNNHE